ncbi:unnamed protein product, partial [Didymodactylos carnosus]
NKLVRTLNMNIEDNDATDVLDALAENVLHDLASRRRATRLRAVRERNNADWMINDIPDLDCEKTLVATSTEDNNDDFDFPLNYDVFSELQDELFGMIFWVYCI